MKAIKGKDVLMEVYEAGAYTPFLCCEDMSINITPELINKTTLSSGKGNQYKARRFDWDLSLSGISQILGDGRTIFETVKVENIFSTWPIRLTFADAQGNTAIFTGNVVLKNASITGPQSDFSDFENAFQGSGIYNLVIDDTNPEGGGCEQRILLENTAGLLLSESGDSIITEAICTSYSTEYTSEYA